MEHVIRIQSIIPLTHDVRSYRCEKPADYHFTPGQATEVSINKEEWKEEKRPFTFTSLNEDPYLEFTIKSYHDHEGVTNQLGKLQVGDELIVRDIWGAIEYKGPGYFIAGGAGITPFIAILRELFKNGEMKGNHLFFSNKTDSDIILEEEFKKMLGENAIHVITDEEKTQHNKGFINEQFLKENVKEFNKKFYVCGPPKMVEAMKEQLNHLGASTESIVFEK